MKNLRSNKGFTLVELAIVLVIIGIILGAVLKGQDLIHNARIKKFINDAGRKFEVATWTFYDRNGKFPGDCNNDGIIGNGTCTNNVKTDLATNSKLIPDDYNPVRLGSYSFLVGLGNDGGTPSKNVMVICPTSDGSTCNTPISSDELEFFKAFDTAIDGSADAGKDSVRGATSASFTSSSWIVTPNGIASSPAEWSTSDTALVYYFDRRP